MNKDDDYYVDKTKMIEEVLQSGAMVTLITIKSNLEASHGRADIIYTAKKNSDSNLIIEFKHSKIIEGINELAVVAHYAKSVKVVAKLIIKK